MSRNKENLRSAKNLENYLPSRAELEENLRRLNQLLEIDGDAAEQISDFYEHNQPIGGQELQRRTQARIKEQDEVIYPKRLRERMVTPEWRRYIAKRNRSG